MAKEKKPSIYVDRGTIGSSSELDEYGVWVKSEPREVAFAGEETGIVSDNDDADLAITEIEELPDASGEDSPDGMPEEDFSIPDMSSDLDIDFDIETDEDTNKDVFEIGDIAAQNDLDSGLDLNVTSTETADLSGDLSLDLSADSSLIAEAGDLSMEEIGISFESDDSQAKTDITLEDDANKDFAETSVDISMDDLITPIDLNDNNLSPESNITEPSVSYKNQAVLNTPAAVQTDFSTQLLMKIAEELSSIRTELADLKREFSGIQATAATQKKEPGKDAFEENDDEKLSLTGAELKNIMQTADFTEEAGVDANIDLSDDQSIGEIEEGNIEEQEGLYSSDSAEEKSGDAHSEGLSIADLDSLDLCSPELGEQTAITSEFSVESSVAGIADNAAEISVDINLDSADLDGTAPVFLEKSEELSEILEKGLEPITAAPEAEDALYLAEDPLAGSSVGLLGDDDNISISDLDVQEFDETEGSIELSESDDDSIDLSEAVIDEPDLSMEIHDNPVVEPDLEDISIMFDDLEEDSPDESTSESTSESISIEDLDTGDLGTDDALMLTSEADIQIPEVSENADIMLDMNEDISLDELSLDDNTSEELSLDDIPSGDIPSGEVSPEDDIVLEEDLSDALSFDDVTSEEISLDDATPDELSLDDDTLAELSLDDIPSGEISLDDVTPDELSLDDDIPAELSLDDIPSGEISLDDAAPEEISLDDISSGDIPLDDVTSDELTSEDLSIDETSLEEISLDDISLDDSSLEELNIDDAVIDDSALEELQIDDSVLEELPDELSMDEVEVLEDESPAPVNAAKETPQEAKNYALPTNLKHELKTVLSYLDHLLNELPDDKIAEFARSEHYDTYKKLFKDLGLD